MIKKDSNDKMPFYFHAGESNRLQVQENLVDAVFLNTSRVGHGFGILEFPALWALLNEKGILIEACPISNQVLGLVVDQRNHPVGQMLKHALNHSSDLRPFYRDNSNSSASQSTHKLQQILDRHPNLYHVVDNMLISPSLTVSISNDDPGFWGIDAIVSYDWYVAVLAWDLSLGAIKQLSIDSIVHSSVSVDMKADMLHHWSVSWNKWIESLL